MVRKDVQAAPAYEPPAVEDLPTDGPSSVCAMIVPISPTE
jgi:hypothetical protein